MELQYQHFSELGISTVFNNNSQIIIDFEPISRRVVMEDLGKNLYQMLTDIDIKIRAERGGLGTCGKCQCIIQKGSQFLNKPTE